MKRTFCLLLFLFVAIANSSNEPNWQRIGPSAGSVSQIVPDRNNPNIWYLVENQFSRLYRSIDNGETWKYTGFNGVQKLLVHSASSELFLIVRGDRKFSLFSSRDFARTFQLRSANAPEQIFDHPSDPKTLWGSGVDNPYELSVSNDGGAHWKGFYNLPYRFEKEYDIDGWKLNPDYYYLSSVLVSPLDHKTIYVSTEVEFDLGCSSEIIDLELVSSNFGKTWASTEFALSRYFYDKAFPQRAFSVNNFGTRTLTSNGWKSVSTKGFDEIISVPGRAENLFGVSNGQQWFSRDEGINWGSVDLGPGDKATKLKARSFPEGSLLGGTSGGGIYVIDGRSNWVPAKGLHEALISEVVSAPGSDVIYAIAQDQSSFLYRSLNSGQTWENITDKLSTLKRPHSNPTLVVNQRNVRHIFAIVNDKIFVSFDAGETWNDVPQQLTRVFFAPDFQTVYFSRPGYGLLFRSNDGGRTVQEMPQEYGRQKNTIFDLAIDSFNGYFYTATNRGLFVYKNDGRKPEQIATELSPECLHCLSFRHIVALPTRGQFITETEGGLFKTVNQGVTWRRIDHPRDGRIYVADNRGQHLFLINGKLRESTDGGFSWKDISETVHERLAAPFFPGVRTMTDPRVRPIYIATWLGVFKAQ